MNALIVLSALVAVAAASGGHSKGYVENDATGNTVGVMGYDQNRDGLLDKADTNRDGRPDKGVGYGHGHGNGYGHGYGQGYGHGHGQGYGHGHGHGYGAPAGLGYAHGFGHVNARRAYDSVGKTVPVMGKDQNNDGVSDYKDRNRDGKEDKHGYGYGQGYGRGFGHGAHGYGAH